MKDYEFRKAVARKTKVSFETVTMVFRGARAVLTEEVCNGNEVNIKGVGKFYTKMTTPRRHRSLETGEIVSLEPRKTLKFKVANRFQNYVRYGKHFREEDELINDEEF